MKTLALLVGLVMFVVGMLGVIVPSALVVVAQHLATPVGLYVSGLVRVAIGLVLVAVAPASRYPIGLRVLGGFVFIVGLVTPLIGLERTHAIVDWWTAQGIGAMRLWSMIPVVLGVYVVLGTMDRHGAAVRRARRAT